MKIAILCRRTQNYTIRRLIEEAIAGGHTPHVLDPFGFYLHIGGQGKRIYYEGTSVEDLDVVLPRLGQATVKYGQEIVAHFEWIGVPVINRSTAIANAQNKFRTLRILAQHGLPVPPSFIARCGRFLDQSVRETGATTPYLMKPFERSHGKATLLLDTPTALRAVVDAMDNLRQDYVIQPFINESMGKNVRVIVIGAKVIAAVEQATQEEERKHFTNLPDEDLDIAIQAVEVMTLGIASVDLLQTENGAIVLEINPSPWIEETETLTGVNVAKAIIEFAVEYHHNSRPLKLETPLA